MGLAKSVIVKDHELEARFDTAGAELSEWRWHHTLDESNPKRVTFTEYADSVQRARSTIAVHAKGWAAKLADEAAAAAGKKVVTKSLNDYKRIANVSAQKTHAAEALAKVKGKSVAAVTQTHSEEIKSVVKEAKFRAEETGTTVEEQIDKAVEWSAKAKAADEKVAADKKANHTTRYLEVESDLGVAMQRLRKVLDNAKDVGFSDDEIELISSSLTKLRALMNLIDLRIAGETNIDWDAEFQKIG